MKCPSSSAQMILNSLSISGTVNINSPFCIMHSELLTFLQSDHTTPILPPSLWNDCPLTGNLSGDQNHRQMTGQVHNAMYCVQPTQCKPQSSVPMHESCVHCSVLLPLVDILTSALSKPCYQAEGFPIVDPNSTRCFFS